MPSPNLTAVGLLLLDLLPRPLVTRNGYGALRRRLSRHPERFRSATPGDPPEAWPGRKLVSPDTDLVIDGFPGSGNSYLANCVGDALPSGVILESHFHYTVQLRRALAFGVPALVVVRPPRDACRSLKSKQPELADTLIVLRWLLYHRYVLRRAGDLDLILFADVVADVDRARRVCPALAALLQGRRIDPKPEYRRRSARRRHLDHTRPLIGRWLPSADALYSRIAREAGAASMSGTVEGAGH